MRKTGHYWVKYHGTWIVGYFFNTRNERLNHSRPYWNLLGYDDEFFDREFDEINETGLIQPEDHEALKTYIESQEEQLKSVTLKNEALLNKLKNRSWFHRLFNL